jgi:hypothetical protein
MTERQNAAGEKAQAVPNESDKRHAQSPEEAKIWEILEQARQKVKPIVKKEKEAEILTGELLNLRLKAH